MKCRTTSGPRLEIRIVRGLNSGRMSGANMGSHVRLGCTVMGDAVNLASPLERLTKEYGTDIIAGEATQNAVPEVVFREFDRVRVKDETFIERIAFLRVNPPGPDWDGAFTFQTK